MPDELSTDRKLNMQEVARAAGVAVSSVSRVLANHPYVSDAMRQRVLRVVQEIGYEPDFLAQSLRLGATHTVGFALSDITNPVVAQIARGVGEVLRTAGYSLLVLNSENDPARDVANLQWLQARRVDGIILTVVNERHRDTLATLKRLKIPLIAMDREFPASVAAGAVLIDHRAGINEAIDHLYGLGHRAIGMLSWPLTSRPGRERAEGFRQALAKHGINDAPYAVTGIFTEEEAAQATIALLGMDVPPTALIIGANQLLPGCLRALAEKGCRIGRDIALVAYDDAPLLSLFTPPLAVIARDNGASGRAAGQLLLRQMREASTPETLIIPTRFVPRASVGAPPARRKS